MVRAGLGPRGPAKGLTSGELPTNLVLDAQRAGLELHVSGSEKEAVETPLADLKTALAGNDNDAIKTATDTLMSASQAFSQKLYEAAAKDADGAGSSASGQDAAGDDSVNDDDIVDAEIVDDEN